MNICDKRDITLQDPYEDESYYPTFKYELLDGSGKTLHFDSTPVRDSTGSISIPLLICVPILKSLPIYETFVDHRIPLFLGEIQAIRKVIPVNLNASVQPWRNDTVEVFRTCPSYVPSEARSTMPSLNSIEIIGRNFRPTSVLACRFHSCIGTEDVNYPGPWRCVRGVKPSDSSISPKFILTKGEYLSPNRIRCPLPEYKFPIMNSEALEGKSCVVSEGKLGYIRNCSDVEIAEGACDSGPRGPLPIFTSELLIPCDPNSNSQCTGDPAKGLMWNPCLMAEVRVEVTVGGARYSGDGLEYPHTEIPVSYADKLNRHK